MSIQVAWVGCCAALLATACGTGNVTGSMKDTVNDPGASIYNTNCVMCHGRDGNLGMSGAKELTKSTLTKEEMIAIVTKGRGGMIGFEKMLSAKEIDEVVDHVRTLHTAE
jgi:cytochrome c6